MVVIRGTLSRVLCFVVVLVCSLYSRLPSYCHDTHSYSFGYVVDGSDFLTDIKEGDIIVSAKVTDGLDKLKQPSTS
jgi:cyclophilin family peptidyl-prolyl cis-trans isomerase